VVDAGVERQQRWIRSRIATAASAFSPPASTILTSKCGVVDVLDYYDVRDDGRGGAAVVADLWDDNDLRW
jgi:hypothetical protein